jgi:hypothetical protein
MWAVAPPRYLRQRPGPAAMTDDRSADQIITDIFGSPTSQRELADRIVLLENLILYLKATNKGLEQLADTRDHIKMLKSML